MRAWAARTVERLRRHDTGAATVTQEPYRARSIRRNSAVRYASLPSARLPLAQLIVPVPLSRRAASAIEPVIEG